MYSSLNFLSLRMVYMMIISWCYLILLETTLLVSMLLFPVLTECDVDIILVSLTKYLSISYLSRPASILSAHMVNTFKSWWKFIRLLYMSMYSSWTS